MIKILHITDLHFRHNGRLFYSTGKKINNGLILMVIMFLIFLIEISQAKKKIYLILVVKNIYLTQSLKILKTLSLK